jgi:hypothetical protein
MTIAILVAQAHETAHLPVTMTNTLKVEALQNGREILSLAASAPAGASLAGLVAAVVANLRSRGVGGLVTILVADETNLLVEERVAV